MTDFLLNLADMGLFEPVWSDEIHAEWMRNLHSAMHIPVDKIAYRKSEMERAYPAANCPTGPGALSAVLSKCSNDDQRKDAHVIGTAVSAEATLIVTDNIPDFPQHILDGYGIRKLRPDDFCVELFGVSPAKLIAAARQHRATLKRTSPDAEAYLSYLAKNDELSKVSVLLAKFADRL